MKNISVKTIQQEVYRIFSDICFSYEKTTKEKMIEAYSKAETSREKEVLKLLLDNETTAINEHIPLCQDTGMAIVDLTVGQDIHFIDGDINEAINNAVAQAYKDNYLRYSVVDDPLFDRKNTFNNTPALIHYNIVSGDSVEIICLAKGFGSENCSKLAMLAPSASVNGVKETIIDFVKEKGANCCPPLTIGVGIGGSADKCSYLAKKALLRSDEHNSDERYKQLEIELLEEINKLDIGPAGLHGKTTALKVAVEYFPTHIAAFPVAININCHAVRKGYCKL